jgi:hypothetical protein
MNDGLDTRYLESLLGYNTRRAALTARRTTTTCATAKTA